jgi:heme exporter protein B
MQAVENSRVTTKSVYVQYINHLKWLLYKEWLIEWRSRIQLTTIFFFVVIALGVFGLALQVEPDVQRKMMPGVLWVALAFGGTLGMGRLFSPDLSGGGLDGLRMTPISREVIFLAKQLSLLLFLLICGAWAVPLSAVMFQVDLRLLWSPIIPIVILGLWGISILGTLISAVLLHTRFREILLPLLFLPLALPLIIASARSTAELIGVAGIAYTAFWLRSLLIFDILLLAIGLWLFSPLLEQ